LCGPYISRGGRRRRDRNGDVIGIDVNKKKINGNILQNGLSRRKKKLLLFRSKITGGWRYRAVLPGVRTKGRFYQCLQKVRRYKNAMG